MNLIDLTTVADIVRLPGVDGNWESPRTRHVGIPLFKSLFPSNIDLLLEAKYSSFIVLNKYFYLGPVKTRRNKNRIS